ncbi:MAG: 2-keto-4-pentenoate hydratase/2-oxohepta-3-ene-1,7-dioic acid hydratase in catechol pathway [Myxococcota bacterium]|jgi:2-keto-4-pentenoate hydratase/2-oxohepta-3-ene-1,7-dioic acid hydratase in catechol pathway
MKLATFTHSGSTRIGVVDGNEVVDLTVAAPDLPTQMLAFLEAGDDAMQAAHAAVAGGKRIPLADVHLEAPIARPPKFLAIGLNYADHVAESGMDTPEHVMIFNKQSTCVTGPTDPVHVPKISHVLDYEGELGIVIGKHGRHVSRENAAEYIAGYTVVDDVTVRDWQFHTPTWTMGKSFDTHGPIGPWIVTTDEIPDPHQLELRTYVNDELRQESNTKQLIFDCFHLVEHISKAFTLEPGDIIATGTPGGAGLLRKPPCLLKDGDVVRVEIDGIGKIENPVIDEPADTVR